MVGVFLLAASRASFLDPDPTLLVRDRHGAFLGELPGEDADGMGYWPVQVVPPRVQAATVALEDRRFHDHPGVDPLAVARAVRQNLVAGRVISGASTVAMQVARMQSPGARSLPNKLVEATTALLLTARYGREGVMAQYLRLAPYGNNIHGIAYAARRYLDKPVADLSWAETAFLCALPQAPSRTNPFDADGRARAVARARRILDVLVAQGLLDPTELAQAQGELDHLVVPDRGRRPEVSLHALLRLGEELGRTGTDPLVVASIDLPVQRAVQAAMRARLDAWAGDGAGNAAAVVVDRVRWEVVAYVGSSGYFDPRHAGSIDYARVPRNPGSTLKPFFYAAALDRGVIQPTGILDDLGRAAQGIENADGASLGPMLPRRALANSRNVPAVAVLERLGVGEGYGLLRQLGLHHDESPASRYGVGLAVGAMPVTLDALTTAYTALAGDGRVHRPSWVAGGSGAAGPTLFTDATTDAIALWLSDPMARLPSFPRMGATEYPFPVAVKTGTSPDYRDSWAMAWSDRYLVGVWVGDPDYTPMRRLSGFRGAAELVHDILVPLHADEADGLADRAFPAPAGTEPRRICALTGQRATEACEGVVTEQVPVGTAPAVPCTAHRRLLVDVATGALATARTPPAAVTSRTFADLPARYAAWQEGAGIPRSPGVAVVDPADPPVMRVVAPRSGERFLRDHELSPELSSIALRATVEPAVGQLVWYVDGQPFAVVGPPYEARWPLEPGEHVFEVRVPYTPYRSPPVKVAAGS